MEIVIRKVNMKRDFFFKIKKMRELKAWKWNSLCLESCLEMWRDDHTIDSKKIKSSICIRPSSKNEWARLELVTWGWTVVIGRGDVNGVVSFCITWTCLVYPTRGESFTPSGVFAGTYATAKTLSGWTDEWRWRIRGYGPQIRHHFPL
jgi:hypothetical protein